MEDAALILAFTSLGFAVACLGFAVGLAAHRAGAGTWLPAFIAAASFGGSALVMWGGGGGAGGGVGSRLALGLACMAVGLAAAGRAMWRRLRG